MLETIDLQKTYKFGKVAVDALKRVNLRIHEGEFVAVVGPSGCGKSTLLHVLGAIARPTRGKVLIAGQNLSEMTDRQLTEVRRGKIGFVFQRFNLLPTLTASDNIQVARYIHRMAGNGHDPHRSEILQLLMIGDKMDRKPSELSGGEQQRVAIARAVASRPSILLADEPTGNLDSKNSETVLDMFRALNRRFKQTIILVTHNLELVAYADRVVEMRDGAIVSDDGFNHCSAGQFHNRVES
jgi:putative ABC transport system ATP-binding protein